MKRGITMILLKRDPYFSYVNADGKLVSGTASLLHRIKKVGGIKEYNKEIGQIFIRRFMDKYGDLSPDDPILQGKRECL